MPYLEFEDPSDAGARPETASGPRRVEVGGDVTVGRGDDCDLQLPEKKASRRHLSISRAPGEPWVLTDLDSSNGTFLSPPSAGGAEARVARALLVDGAVLRVGDTRLRWCDPPASGAAPRVGGTLALRAVDGPAAVPAPVPAPAPAPAPAAAAEVSEAAGEPSGPLPPLVRTRPFDQRAFGRGLLLAVVGLVAAVGVTLTLGARAERAREEVSARRSLERLLALGDADRDVFVRRAEDWLAEHPASPDRALLERHLAAARGRSGVRADVEQRFETIMARLGALPEAQVRADLLALKRALPEDGSLAERVRLAFAELDRRRVAFQRAEGERLRTEAADLVARRLPGVALRRLSAWRESRGLLDPEEAAPLREAETRAAAAVRQLSDTVLAAARAETDPARRRALLMEAWPGLAGTFAQQDLADALRFASQPLRPSGGPGSAPGPSTGPDPGEALLARAAEAEKLVGARRFAQARAAFESLLAQQAPALLAREWSTRRAELDWVLGLIDALSAEVQAAAAGGAGAAPVVRRLAAGPTTVTRADAEGVTLERAGTAAPQAWSALEPDDLLALLARPKPTKTERLGLAVLAAALSRPEALLGALTPLYEAGAPGAEVDALVARHLEGRPEAPAGGYRLYQGGLVDEAGYRRRLEEERLAALEVRARDALARLQKDPALRKLERMREARAELDRRRTYALLAIFNEKHYPYPYQRQPPYTIVQSEVDRRVALVRELWDGEDSVRLSRSGQLARHVDEVAAAVKELAAAGRDTAALSEGLAGVERYLTGETLRLRDFALNDAEQKLLAYNRWVMQVYNPSRTAYATEGERKQVEITNAYRMMLGFTLAVTPGDADYMAIDETNVVKVLDAGRVVPTSVVHLLACRIDDRLMRSARLHSEDMARRSYFDHFAPPDPATGAPRRSPFDRMRDAGYQGHGASENIASVGGDPLSPHEAWCHSSGHHRNLLSAWADMGSGAAGGRLWTQNFGTGGGRPTVIEELPAPAKR